jgi:hypothetical protein
VTLTSSPESWTDKFRPVCLVPAWQFMLPEYRYYMFVFRILAVQPAQCGPCEYKVRVLLRPSTHGTGFTNQCANRIG